MDELIDRLVETGRAYREAVSVAQREGPALVRGARSRLGLTQRALAERLGVDHTYLSKIENGHMAPSRALLTRLSRLLAGEVDEDDANSTPKSTPDPVSGNEKDAPFEAS